MNQEQPKIEDYLIEDPDPKKDMIKWEQWKQFVRDSEEWAEQNSKLN